MYEIYEPKKWLGDDNVNFEIDYDEILGFTNKIKEKPIAGPSK